MVKARKQEMNIVESTIKEKGLLRKYRISDGWFRHFTERQPQFSLRKGDSTAFDCMDAMKKQKKLDDCYIIYEGLTNYNVHESLVHCSPPVIARKR